MYYICGKISKLMKNIDTHAAALMQEIIRNLRIDLTRRGALDKLQQQMETILDDKGNRNCGGFSVSTLKRLLGKVSSSGRFDLNTLDKLALIAGYADYATYLDRQNRTVLLSGTRETLDFSGCVPDSVITIREGANSLRLQNLGEMPRITHHPPRHRIPRFATHCRYPPPRFPSGKAHRHPPQR